MGKKHIVISWIIAFNFLHSIEAFCNQIKEYRIVKEPNQKAIRIKGKPRIKDMERKGILPPRITKTLSLENVTSIWRGIVQEYKAVEKTMKEEAKKQSKKKIKQEEE